MPRPGRHIEGAQTRERVLDAAAKFISSHGYAATSIAKISKESGANPASIYWAFEDKEALFAAVMERSAESFFETLRSAGPRSADPWEALTRLAKYFEEGPEFLRLLLVLSLERRDGDPTVLEAARRVRSHAMQDLARGYAAAFEFRDAEQRDRIAEELARLTLMLIDGAFIAAQIEPDTTDLERTFEVIAISVKAVGDHLLEDAGGRRRPRGKSK